MVETGKSSILLKGAQAAFADAPPGVRPATLDHIVFVNNSRTEASQRIPYTKVLHSEDYGDKIIVAFTAGSPRPGLAVRIGSQFPERNSNPDMEGERTVRDLLADEYGLRPYNPGGYNMQLKGGTSEVPFNVALNNLNLANGLSNKGKKKYVQFAISSSLVRQVEYHLAPFGYMSDGEIGRPVTPDTAQDLLSGIAGLYDRIRETLGPKEVEPINLHIVYREPVEFLPADDSPNQQS